MKTKLAIAAAVGLAWLATAPVAAQTPTTGAPAEPTTGTAPAAPTTGEPTTGAPAEPTTGAPAEPTTGAPAEPTTGAPATPAAPVPTPPTGADAAGEDYTSPMREQCEAELKRDARWRSNLRGQLANTLIAGQVAPEDGEWRDLLHKRLTREVHERDANQMLRNRKHVVMAYAAMWVLVVLFAAYMWIKQRDLKAEIARLSRDIDQATAEDVA